MREDHIEYGYDSTAQSYYHTVGEADGSPVYGPNMATVRRARHGLNQRHFPNHSESYLARHPEAAPVKSRLDRGRDALERATDHFLFLVSLRDETDPEVKAERLRWANEQLAECNDLYELAARIAANADPYIDVETGQRLTPPEVHKLVEATARRDAARKRVAVLAEPSVSDATIAAARGEVKRIAAKLEAIRDRRTVTAPDDREQLGRMLSKFKGERSDVSRRINRAKHHHVQGEHTRALVDELQQQRIQLSKFIDALDHRFTQLDAPSGNRPERSHLVGQRMVVGSFDVEEYEPVGFAIYSVHEPIERPVLNCEGEPVEIDGVPQTKREHVEHFYVTQFVYRTVNVRNDVEVHKLNRSYLMGGEPMLYPPKSKTYRVMEPAEAWHGPFTSVDDAEQVAEYWKAECVDIYNDSDRILGRDTEPTRT